MTELFLQIVNMSILASWLVLVVLCLRMLLKKSPKWIFVMLWGIVAIRLICPFSIESAVSFIPSAETISKEILSEPSFQIQTGIAAVDSNVNDYLGDHYFEGVTVPANTGYHCMTILSVIWLVGMLLLFVYTMISYLRLQRKVDMAVLLRENIYQSEQVKVPFVLGVIQPKIYLPFQLEAQKGKQIAAPLWLNYVIAHEQAHIKRKDHWWKPFGFFVLVLHWFNPLIWLSYLFFCRDMEQACDEKVIQTLEKQQRADYAQTLLSFQVNHKMITVCPLSFGEIGVKERVKMVLNYKKPTFWIVGVSMVVCVAAAICFLTNPKTEDEIVSSFETAQGSEMEDTQSAADTNEVQQTEQISLDEVMDRIVERYPISNALPYEEKVENLEEDALVLLCQSEHKKYIAYGFISPEYGKQGILIDNIIDGESNWNYFYESWDYGNTNPTLTEQGEYELIFTYTQGNGAEKEVSLQSYDTGTIDPKRWSKLEVEAWHDLAYNYDMTQVFIEEREITAIAVKNGWTGEKKKVSVTDSSNGFRDILNGYYSLNVSPDEELEVRSGYQYSMELYDANGEILQTITPYKDCVNIDGIMYDGSQNGTTTQLLLLLDALEWQ